MPTYNKCSFLQLTLTGFTMQIFEDFEIIIVDDGSIDQTREVVNLYEDKLRLVYFYQNNRGRACARNKALELAKGDYLIFCDDDRIPAPDFLEKHMQLLKKNDKVVTIGYKKEILSILRKEDMYTSTFVLEICKRHPEILCRDYFEKDVQLFSSDELLNDFDTVICKHIRIEPADNFRTVFLNYDKSLTGFTFGWVLGTTANLGIDRKAIERVKFDEQYIGWGMEDTDFSYCLYREGYQFVLAKEAINFHQYHEKDADYVSTLNNNTRYFYHKYGSIEAALFVLLMKSQKSIIEINNLYYAIKEEQGAVLSKAYLDILQLAISDSFCINSSYLS